MEDTDGRSRRLMTTDASAAPYAAHHPPSAVRSAPLTSEASSQASHEMAAAIWSGCAGVGGIGASAT